MKRLAQKSILTIIAIAIIIIGAVTITDNKTMEAKALPPNYMGESDTIYYFTNYYPTVGYTTMYDEFSDEYNIIYDRQMVSAVEFADLVNADYFTGFGDNCLVIIDLKKCYPMPGVLNSLFYNLKVIQECKTVFVTDLDGSLYQNEDFIEYLDVFYVSDYNKLELFHMFALEDFARQNGYTEDLDEPKIDYLKNSVIIIDGNILNINLFYGQSMDSICSVSPFYKALLDELAIRFGLTGTYTEIAEILNDDYDIRLLVHAGGDVYIDIFNWQIYYAMDITTLMNYLDATNDTPFNYCVMGFNAFDQDFYNCVLALDDNRNLPIYTIEVDPYGDGLMSIDFTELLANIDYCEEYKLRELLHDLLD